MNEQNVESYIDAINTLITWERIEMRITLPEGTQVAEVRGTDEPTIDFFLLLSAFKRVFLRTIEDMGGVEKIDAKGVLDAMLDMFREDILETLKGGKGDEP